MAGDAGGHWWEREEIRIVNVITSTNQIAAREPGALAGRKADLGFNAEHFEVMNMPAGLDDRGFVFRSSVAPAPSRDYLGDYLPEAHKKGIRVLIYFNVHWTNQTFAREHPDWVQIRQDGKPLDGVYQTGTSMCVNSPWREWCFRVVRDLAAYPIDGIFYDGPIFFPETCYCRYCREKYRQRYGAEMPPKSTRRGKDAQRLLEFQAASLQEYLRDSRRAIKAVNPAIAFYMNGGLRGGNWATGRLNRTLVDEQDILGTEGGFLNRDLWQMPIWKPGVNARLLETQAGGKPRVIFSATPHKPWTFSILPAPEIRLLYAGSIANGANIWFGMWPSEFDLPEMNTLGEMNRFFAGHARYYQNTRSEARTAIVWSDLTANFYEGSPAELMDGARLAGSRPGDPEAEFTGLTEALVRTHIPFDVIDDVSLEKEDLSRYGSLILPNVACMTDTAAARLREFVSRGGNLIATFETSRYDEAGIPRSDFALSELLGVRYAGRVLGPRRWDYLKPRRSSQWLAGLDRAFLPSPTYGVRVAATAAEPILSLTVPLPGPYDGIPEVSPDPALTVRTLGKGKVVYMAGDLGGFIQGFHMADPLRLAGNMIRELSPAPVVLENAPASLEVVLRSQEQGSRLLLHLLNSTGEMMRPITRIMPLENLRITLRTEKPAKRIETLVRPGILKPVENRPGTVTLVLPRMEEYEVIVIER